MKNILVKVILVFLAVVVTQSCLSIDKLGGNFAGSPEELEDSVSDGAKELIAKAYSDVNPENLRDHHVHVVGLDEDQGTSVNVKMLSWRHPINRLKTSVYLSGANVDDLENANDQYVKRLVDLIKTRV